jgi:hypothetical protein
MVSTEWMGKERLNPGRIWLILMWSMLTHSAGAF